MKGKARNTQQTAPTEEINLFWYEARADLINRLIMKHCNYFGQLLDVGSGDGWMMDNIIWKGKKDGLDITPPLKNRYDRFYKKSIEKQTGIKKKYDLILCLDCLEHLEKDKDAADNMIQLLKRRGILIISVPAYQWAFAEHDIALSHKRRYTRQSLEKLIDKDRATIIQSTYWGRHLVGGLLIYKILKKPEVSFNKTIRKMTTILLKHDNHVIGEGSRVHFGSSVFLVAKKI
jgi:2-polyprenyl-3-methyl-5-hydroxy-6-metoxy-1,4-benzoquinol methylase